MLTPDDPRLIALYDLPGHVFRRAQQFGASVFDREVGALGVTGGQFVALSAIHIQPGMEQRELSAVIFFDAATTGGIVKRLEAMGALRRQASGRSRRGRALYITPEGEALLAKAKAAISRVSQQLLANLEPSERIVLLGLLSKVAGVANSFNRPAG